MKIWLFSIGFGLTFSDAQKNVKRFLMVKASNFFEALEKSDLNSFEYVVSMATEKI